MKKIFLLIFIVLLFIFGVFNLNNYKSEIVAKMENGCNLIICLDNFDNISEEYKEKFWNLSIPLTLKTSNKDLYNNLKQDDTKFLTNSIIVPKMYMSIIASGDAQEIRNSIYNAVSITKEQGICILIINIDEENE